MLSGIGLPDMSPRSVRMGAQAAVTAVWEIFKTGAGWFQAGEGASAVMTPSLATYSGLQE